MTVWKTFSASKSGYCRENTAFNSYISHYCGLNHVHQTLSVEVLLLLGRRVCRDAIKIWSYWRTVNSAYVSVASPMEISITVPQGKNLKLGEMPGRILSLRFHGEHDPINTLVLYCKPPEL